MSNVFFIAVSTQIEQFRYNYPPFNVHSFLAFTLRKQRSNIKPNHSSMLITRDANHDVLFEIMKRLVGS